MKWLFAVSFFLIFALAALPSCENKNGSSAQSSEEAEVRAQAQRYIDAINSGNVEAIAKFWSPEAVYKNPITGDLVQGREGIKAEFAKFYEQLKDAKVEFRIDSIRFPHEGKASEVGVAVLTLPGQEPIYSDYKMIHVKKNGKWMILHVSQLDFGMLQKKQQKESRS